MKRFTPIFIVFSLLFAMASCGEALNENETKAQIQDYNTRYGSKLTALPQLSDAVKTETDSWSVFEDFAANTSRLKNQTLPSLQGISERLVVQVDSMLAKIPDTLNTRPIYSRLILVNTRAKLLAQSTQEATVDSLQLETTVMEMNRAVQNLFIELNRTFKKSKIDDELKETEKKELENQKKFLDSVYKSELNDNKGN